MADENKQVDKEALKAQKQAEKDALKAKKERIKQSKPKKEGNFFTRMLKAIKKFFKDFKGTCKKVIWPDRKTVLKNTLIVLLVTVIVGAGIWLADFAFTQGIRGVQNAIDGGNETATEEYVDEHEGHNHAEEAEEAEDATA